MGPVRTLLSHLPVLIYSTVHRATEARLYIPEISFTLRGGRGFILTVILGITHQSRANLTAVRGPAAKLISYIVDGWLKKIKKIKSGNFSGVMFFFLRLREVFTS